MAENQENPSNKFDTYGGRMGYIGIRFFESILNLADKAVWLFGFYYTYHTIVALTNAAGNQPINIDADTLYEQLAELANGYLIKTITALLLVIIVLVVVIVVQYRTNASYKRKTGRLERGIIDPLDPNRGSSELTDKGTTNPGDKP